MKYKIKTAKSGIHINPKNKDKFNALKKKTGKSTEELTHSKNPLTRKRAIFAQNVKKWKHLDGGEVMYKDGIKNKASMSKSIKLIPRAQKGAKIINSSVQVPINLTMPNIQIAWKK